MDVALQANRDVPNLDTKWEMAKDAKLAAQNIIEALFTPVGSLPWDRPHGSILIQMLNDVVSPPVIIQEIRRVALEVSGVAPESLVVAHFPGRGMRGEYAIGFVGQDGATQSVTVSA